ncbi:MAG: ATP-binding cassette domain-containing protein [Bryobacteraceae bacterium]
MRRFFAPEVVQTSALDCGPASLKCLLEGFAIHVGYDRLREACQTGIDGTSIDTMETVAAQLGLEAEQVMLPVDHLLLPESKALPAVVVVKLPTGITHFVVAWRCHGGAVQVMDPAIGRHWLTSAQFVNDVFCHSMLIPAESWRDFAASEDFQAALKRRLGNAGLSRRAMQQVLEEALGNSTWNSLAALDAAVRLMTQLARAGGLNRAERTRLLARLSTTPDLIPAAYWSARPGPDNPEGQPQVFMRGAVLVRIRGKKTAFIHESSSSVPPILTPELAAAINERPINAGRELLSLLWKCGSLAPGTLVLALAIAAGGVVIEALLFRGLFDIAGELRLTGQRLAALVAILCFSLVLVLLEAPLFSGALRLGRQLETRLRVAFLTKIPNLSDRYFQSRLTSDMAERCHTMHRLRYVPELGRQLVRTIFELCTTAAGVIWLEPAATPLVLLTLAAALLPAFTTQGMLAGRDLRVRSHAAGLTRFYLDAMLGLLAIRAHSAESSLRRAHEALLGQWGDAALRLQKAVISIEGLQFTAMFSLIVWLVLGHPLQATDMGRVLLVVYWALNLPILGQEIGTLARQYPSYRNLTLRLLDPLRAPEEPAPNELPQTITPNSAPPRVHFRNVSIEVSGHAILQEIDFEIAPGTHVAVIGPSGAGKSSLVGVLLGWLKPNIGEVLVNGSPLCAEQLRVSTAWVDPALQLWNSSLFSNLTYGSDQGPAAVGQAIDAALLRSVLETLPKGLQTKLGEGGALVSGGEGQRVRFGRALLHKEARLVILDEPFRGLDREKRRELLRRAREFWEDCTLLCITHDLEETRGFDRVLVIEHGRLREDGTPAQLCSSPNSRYSQLLEAETQVRSGLWSSRLWRRIHIQSGRIVEKWPERIQEKQRETEVA